MSRSLRHSRRKFITLGSAAALGIAVPHFVPSRASGNAAQPGANDRVNVGVIGTGGRGAFLAGRMPATGRVVALCDCYEKQMELALKNNGSPKS